MSDSESSEEIEVKVEQQHEARVKQLIEKGKEILPFYSEESLFNIYKQSFHNDTVFLNKLQIIVKQNQINEQDKEGWIYEKKHEKTTVPKGYQVEQNRPKRQRYNFLQDKKLIERALKFKREDPEKRDPQPKVHQQFKQKVQQNEQLPPKENQQDQKDKPNQTVQKKKPQYKEKQEAPQPVKNDVISKPVPEVILQSNEKKQVKPVKGYAEKKTKYAQKKQQKNQPAVGKQTIKQEKTPAPAPSVPLNKFQQKKVVNEVIPNKEKKVQSKNTNEVENKTPKPIVFVPKVEKPVFVQKKQTTKTTSTVKVQNISVPVSPPAPASRPELVTSPSPVKAGQKIESTVLVAKQSQQVKIQVNKKVSSQREVLDPEVEKQFENSYKQNSFILKFIKPSHKLQQVSYIRTPDGAIKEVKVKQPLAKKN